MSDSDNGFLAVGEKAESDERKRVNFKREQKESEDKFQREMAEILAPLPEEFRSFVSWRAWEYGHSAGYNEVVNYAITLAGELLPAVQAYTKKIKE